MYRGLYVFNIVLVLVMWLKVKVTKEESVRIIHSLSVYLQFGDRTIMLLLIVGFSNNLSQIIPTLRKCVVLFFLFPSIQLKVTLGVGLGSK